MSTAASRYGQCERKRAYKNARHAIIAADRAAQGQGREREKVRAYKCEHCGRWHLTSMGGDR